MGPYRNVWSNDIQHFAHLVAKATFCSQELVPHTLSYIEACGSYYESHRGKLAEEWKSEMEAERIASHMVTAEGHEIIFQYALSHANSICSDPNSKNYDVFVNRFSGTYLSYAQAIDFDSLRYALDTAKENSMLTSDAYQWALVALCIGLSKCATTTGHFAQPLSPKHEILRRYNAQRNRSLYVEWSRALDWLGPIGSKVWRRKNRVYRHDALELLGILVNKTERPSVIYADPPYTKDQYSRYYHVYETAVLYDYPEAIGRGLYRTQRASSSFSSKALVESSLDELIRKCADIGADLVLSYPTNGLLDDSQEILPSMLRKHYRRKPQVLTTEHVHSTMGASKGADRHDVTEAIYMVKRK